MIVRRFPAFLRLSSLFSLVACLSSLQIPSAAADPPELASWIRNTDGHTGYAGIVADVQKVYYSDDFVYVECTGIPAYTIGPWPGNPNTATNQNFRFKIDRSPAPAAIHTATPLGPIGVWRNGVVIFNARDAFSYQNRNVWHQDAVVAEASSFDACLGHPQQSGVYHHHQNPPCLYSAADTSQHSPILGYAFDGIPVYGPYAYSGTDGTGGVRRIRSGYRKRTITQRTTLPDGTVLDPADYGPPVSPTYPVGYYIEDYEHVAAIGDLDAFNGRFSVTPEYPAGTYAYFVTIDAGGASAYPYVVGPSYYGTLVAGNTGPGGGHVVIEEPVTEYNPNTPVLLAHFTARTVEDGVELEWRFTEPSSIRRVTVQRAGSSEGPWRDLAFLEASEGSGGSGSAIDRTVEPGGIYYYRLAVLSRDGESAIYGPVRVETGFAGTSEVALAPVFPNPALEFSRFDYETPREAEVELSIFDVQGRRIADLERGRVPAGRHEVVWGGLTDRGERVPAGVYFVRLASPVGVLVRRFVVAR